MQRQLIACCAGLVGLAMAVPAAAQVRPQYSVEEVQRRLGSADAKPDTSGQPKIGAERAFSLARSAPAPATTTRKGKGRAATNRFALAQPRPRNMDLLINFANASAELTPQAQANARVLAQALSSPQLAGTRIAIDGHTNAVGNAAYNKKLSEDRAEALATYLAANGVDRSRLEVHGYGYDRPLNARNTRAAENRRVEGRRL